MAAATGRPSANPVSAVNPASTGQRAWPSLSGGAFRCAIGPVLLTRAPPRRSVPSPASTSRLITTRTRESAAEVAKL